MTPRIALLICAAVLLLMAPSKSEPAFDAKPWLEDLNQVQAAFAHKYANLEWAVFDRGADLNDYFVRARKRIERAQDAGSAKAAFDGLIRRLGDGHVEIKWPNSPTPKAAGDRDVCNEAGFDSTKSGAPLAALARGYAPLATAQSPAFPAGIIAVGRHRVGVLKIGLFSAEGTPALCREAIVALSIARNAACPDECADRIRKWTEARMNDEFIAQVEALQRAGIDALLVDITGNGGGTEWAEAAARMLTPVRLKSERVDFVRGPQWTKEFGDAEAKLREAAGTAAPNDRVLLLELAASAMAKRSVAATPCNSAPLWKGEYANCPWLGEGFYASGMINSADPAQLRGKPWAATVFTPMQYRYREAVWHGPLIVLVDGESWSASEEFAAVLQDNHAALVIGEPTGGAGCGHTDGSESEVLKNSGGKLDLPDCARIRADGSNEVRGILPDLPIGWGRHDGPQLRAASLSVKLPEVIAKARVTVRHK